MRAGSRLSWGLVAALLTFGAARVSAEDQAPAPVQGSRLTAPHDFAFKRPIGRIGVHVGWSSPSEHGDFFAFLRENLTVDRGAFRTPVVGLEVGIAPTSRVLLVFGYDQSKASVGSETRRYVGTDGLPILQDTELTIRQVSVGARVPLTAPGRHVGNYAWIPASITPFVGGGVSLVYYDFWQRGEFVDFQDLSIFKQAFTSHEWTRGAHVSGGVDLRTWKRVILTFEGRYTWANGSLSDAYSGFNGIELGGFRMLTGVSVPF